MENKKFDYCIMNPPYGNLHLKILNVVSDKVKYEIVNLSPVVNYVSLKNAYSSVHMNKFNKQPLKNKCCNVVGMLQSGKSDCNAFLVNKMPKETYLGVVYILSCKQENFYQLLFLHFTHKPDTRLASSFLSLNQLSLQ